MLVETTAARSWAFAAARSASACLARASGEVSEVTVFSAALKNDPIEPHALIADGVDAVDEEDASSAVVRVSAATTSASRRSFSAAASSSSTATSARRAASDAAAATAAACSFSAAISQESAAPSSSPQPLRLAEVSAAAATSAREEVCRSSDPLFPALALAARRSAFLAASFSDFLSSSSVSFREPRSAASLAAAALDASRSSAFMRLASSIAESGPASGSGSAIVASTTFVSSASFVFFAAASFSSFSRFLRTVSD